MNHAPNATARRASPRAPSAARRRRPRGSRRARRSAAAGWRATAARWPEPQITAIGCVGSMPSGQRADVVVRHDDGAGDVAGVPLVLLAHVEELKPRSPSPALVQLGHRRGARSTSTGSRSSRQLVIPPARKPRDAAQMPTAAASSARARASSSSRPTSTTRLVRIGEPGELASRSPARSAVMQIAPGMCASSNCRSVRTSTTRRRPRCACSTWRGVSGWASTAPSSAARG